VKKLTVVTLFILFLFPVHVLAKNLAEPAAKSASSRAKNEPATAAKNVSAPVAEQFKKSFPKNNFESITPTAIKGIYEVYTGNQIFYYMPAGDVILYGSLISKDGVNITHDSFLKKMSQKIAKLPLDSALKIGTGTTAVVEFMDPNCYHCRQAYKFFSQRKDVTSYVFLIPILSKDSGDKIKHILCSKDVLKTYDDVMNGKLDNNAKLTVCTDKKVDETVKTHMQLASQVGIKATPLFYIKGQVVEGFDLPVMEKLLKE
jgi:thiol:disulfide interchange protein DsbC